MVSMVRALIADPALVNKARDGEEHLIRPCIGSNFGCVGNLMSTGTLVVRRQRGRRRGDDGQLRAPSPADGAQAGARRRRRSGGLEAARTAALRGHEVHLYEATRRLGGQVAIAASRPTGRTSGRSPSG